LPCDALKKKSGKKGETEKWDKEMGEIREKGGKGRNGERKGKKITR